jgi:hypothetical protein
MDYCNLGAVEILKKKVLLSGETSREGRIWLRLEQVEFGEMKTIAGRTSYD